MITEPTIWVTCVLVLLTLIVPRRLLLLPYVVAAVFVPADQRIIIGGLDFTVLRLLVVAGMARVFFRSEIRPIGINKFDKLLLTWGLTGAAVYLLQNPTYGALVFKSGALYDIFLLYWLFRMSLTSCDDIRMLAKILAACAIILSLFVAAEWSTGRNPFEVLGRVSTGVREGQYRCQASFPHSIMLGLFWATALPLIIAGTRGGTGKTLCWMGGAASVFIVLATNSSTPIMTMIVVVMLLPLFQWRAGTATAAKLFLLMLVALHLVMKAPVWHLIARINIISGSTGWHRYHLIDQAISHFHEWALIGCRSTAHWGWGLSDVTNQYVIEGVRGGAVTLVIFLVLIYQALRTFLRASLTPQPTAIQYQAWCLFVAMIGHCVSFFGVSYFGQILLLWYMMLGIAGSVYAAYEKPVAALREVQQGAILGYQGS